MSAGKLLVARKFPSLGKLDGLTGGLIVQAGVTSVAATGLDAVAAISKVLAYTLLRWEKWPDDLRNLRSKIDFPQCRAHLETRNGIGRDSIMAFAPDDAFTTTQVDGALGTLKDSGRMAAIVAEAQARVDEELRIEQEAAEQSAHSRSQ